MCNNPECPASVGVDCNCHETWDADQELHETAEQFEGEILPNNAAIDALHKFHHLQITIINREIGDLMLKRSSHEIMLDMIKVLEEE